MAYHYDVRSWRVSVSMGGGAAGPQVLGDALRRMPSTMQSAGPAAAMPPRLRPFNRGAGAETEQEQQEEQHRQELAEELDLAEIMAAINRVGQQQAMADSGVSLL